MISFSISIELEQGFQELFLPFVNLEYYKHNSKIKSSDGIDFIRICINNLYAKYCDKDLNYSKDYYSNLYLPRNLYNFVVGNSNYIVSYKDVEKKLQDCSEKIEIEKKKSILSKMNIEWKDFKKIIEGYLNKLFDRYIPVNEYELNHKTDNKISYSEFWTEDNYVVGFICKNLKGYINNYYKEYYGVKRKKNAKYENCINCGKLFIKKPKANKVKYCAECSVIIKKERTKMRVKEYRNRCNTIKNV